MIFIKDLKNMKISYIVNVDLTDKVARAVQVYSNAIAFGDLLGSDFECICIGKNTFPFKNIWVNNIKKESSKIRKLIFHISSIKYILNTDVVYSRNLSILYLAKMLNKEIVWEMHDSLDGNNLKIFNKLKKNLKVVVISSALRGYLIENFTFDNNKILVAHDGVFLETYTKIKKNKKYDLRLELNLPIDKYIVMHTGSLYKGRGAELFEVIIKNFPDLYFIQVGGTAKNIHEWEKYYEDYNNIIFIGHQNNETLIKYQISSDLLFLPMTKNSPIWWCTSPMKLFEYMASGVPILASNIGSVGEVLNKKNSIIFNPENEESIKSGVNYFLNNSRKCYQLSKKAVRDIEREFDWNIRVQKIVKFVFND